jgi:hypothetical protein
MYIGMSDEELIGKFGRQYREAKQKLAQLEAEANHYAEELTKVAGILRKPPQFDSPMPPNTVQSIKADYPTKERLDQLITEIVKERQEAERTRKEMKRLGLDLQ